MFKKFLVYSILMLALMAISVYVVTRAVLVGFAEYQGLDMFTAYLLMAGEFFIILHGVGYTINIFRAYRYKREEQEIDRISHVSLMTSLRWLFW
jgi:hypothetical protein